LVGVVTDRDDDTGRNSLLRVRVEWSSITLDRSEIVILEPAEPGVHCNTGPTVAEMELSASKFDIRKGERLYFEVESRFNETCGRLRPCIASKDPIWIATDWFRVVE